MEPVNKKKIDGLIGLALRSGVILSMTCMLLGGVAYLAEHGQDKSAFTNFSTSKIAIPSILQGVGNLQSRSVIYLGIILLILTPVIRVILSLLSFWLEKDKLYTGITLLVMLIILFSIISGHAS